MRIRGVTYAGQACEFFLDDAAIASVYTGRPGCACGCRGRHTEATATPASVRTVRLVMGRILAASEADRVVAPADATGPAHVAVETGKRIWIAYLNPSADVGLVNPAK